MAASIDTEEVRRMNPLPDVLARYGVELVPAGRGRWKAHCPFHSEHTPSFYTYEDGHYHCFGCGEHGDVIGFVRDRLGLGFREAVEQLMGSFGVPEARRSKHAASLRPKRKAPPAGLKDAEEIAVLSAAVELYRNALLSHPEALCYATGRGVGRGVLDRLRVGYCRGGQLLPYLRLRGLQPRIAKRMGLLRWDAERGEHTESFEGRVVVPEVRGGKPIWLVGRPIGEGNPKYLGLPLRPREGLPDGGSKPLLGWEECRDREEVYLCEGVFDRLVLAAWGKPALGLCGTGTPDRILHALRRFARVYLALDSDEAGREARRRLRDALVGRAVPVEIPEVKDVADLALLPGGHARFEEAVARSVARLAA